MRHASSALVLLLGGNASVSSGAAVTKSNLRHNDRRSLRRTVSDECAIVAVKTPQGPVFECEMDPADANGRAGVRRTLKASPQQTDDLKSMLRRGQIVHGETVLVHGRAAFDDDHIHVPAHLSMKAKVLGRSERRLADELFAAFVTGDNEDNCKGASDDDDEFEITGEHTDDKKGEKGDEKGEEMKSYIIQFAKKKGGVMGMKVGPAAMCDAASRANCGDVGLVYTKALNGCSAMLTEKAAKALEGNPHVAMVEPDGEVYKSDDIPAKSWGLDRINQEGPALDGKATRLDATGVRVYILDTGLWGNHDDFKGGMLDESSCHKSIFNDDKALLDGDGHGTHVGSTACGNDYGVATCDTLCSVRVLNDEGSGTWAGVISGIDHAIEDCAASGKRCVLNASLGGNKAQSVNDAVKNLVNKGIVAAVAAGNESEDACTKTPASEPLAIAVGSTRKTSSTSTKDLPSGFSNHGSCVNVFAPGSSIIAARAGTSSSTTTLSGTSMASPHVAGIAAAVLKEYPTLTPAGVMEKIRVTWTSVGVDPDTPGVGIATVNAALDPDATGSPTTSPTPAPPCTGDMTAKVIITTDNWAEETGWYFTNKCDSGADRITHTDNGGGYTTDGETTTRSVTLPCAAYDFTITDAYGDGICCAYGSGSYKVKVDGKTVASGGTFEDSETTSGKIGSCNLADATPSPTKSPTGTPTDSPTASPTSSPTTSPVTPAPTKSPTGSPTKNPTKSPTSSPTKSPVTPAPTKSPTGSPTRSPTKSPTSSPTRSPTKSVATPSPTKSPTGSPTESPVTPSPTKSPTGSPVAAPTDPQLAQYDGSLGAPVCPAAGWACTSGNVQLNGKQTNREENPPNTVDGCEDGRRGDYHYDESVDRIKVETFDGGALREGKRVVFETLVWAWDDGSADRVDFLYTADAEANDPEWVVMGTQVPDSGGANTLGGEYTLPPNGGSGSGGGVQALRVVVRYGGSRTGCGDGTWDDTDDLAFYVAPAGGAGGSAAAGGRRPEDPLLYGLDEDAREFDKGRCAGMDKDRCRAIGKKVCKWKGKRCKAKKKKGEK